MTVVVSVKSNEKYRMKYHILTHAYSCDVCQLEKCLRLVLRGAQNFKELVL